MIYLEKQPHILLQEDGIYQLMGSEQCRIEIDERVHVQLYLTYDKEQTQQQLEVYVHENATLKILMIQDTSSVRKLEHHFHVNKDATITVGYGELQAGNMDANIVVDLDEAGANAHILHASLVEEAKQYTITCHHHHPRTRGIMDNYAIVADAGKYRMEACGHIIKGAYASASHQHTHVLTLSEQHHSEVIPLLLIDENDVEASHAMSLGQPDREQLYYLQSRGLTHQQSLGLLMLGYILPLCTILDDEDLQTQLQELIEKKVGLYA